jgi:chitinase
MRKLVIYSTLLLATLLTVLPVTGQSAAAGSPPKNLRVTGVTDWTVGLRWDAPRGKAPASYVIQSSTGHSMTVPGNQTSATFSSGFDYNRTYSFRAYAVTNGSWSGASNTVTATLLPDTTPPSTPVVTSTGDGPTHIDLAWSCFDASPALRFDIYVDGVLRHGQVAGNSKPMLVLRPDTTYTLQVRARDSGGNWSPMSEPFVATTPSADPNDEKPPTAPPDLWGDIIDGVSEAMIFWGHSVDNVTSQTYIEYFVKLNGVYEGALVGTFHPHQFTLYLQPGVLNTVEVFARDEAGNLSEAAVMTFELR